MLMLEDTESRDYYSASEVAQLVKEAGKVLSTFYRNVDRGNIQKVTEGYKKSDVQAFLNGTLKRDGRKSRQTPTASRTFNDESTTSRPSSTSRNGSRGSLVEIDWIKSE